MGVGSVFRIKRDKLQVCAPNLSPYQSECQKDRGMNVWGECDLYTLWMFVGNYPRFLDGF